MSSFKENEQIKNLNRQKCENDKSSTEQNLNIIKINKSPAITSKTMHSNTKCVDQYQKSDTLLWLHNKLGSTNDSWTDGSICSQYNKEILKNIRDWFLDLQTRVKLKVLFSFVYIPENKLKEWSVELDEIFKLALTDTEQWVSIVAEIIRPLPLTGLFSIDIAQLNHLVDDLRKSVNECDSVLLPLECYYLNQKVFQSVHQKSNVEHFKLKDKLKSTSIKANLLQKSTHAVKHLKKKTTPLMQSKKITDTSSVGVSRPVLKNLSRLQSQKDGGIKLLDINEQPLYLAQAKKRKSWQNLEEVKTASETVTRPVEPDDSVPEYAVGLTRSTFMN